MMTMPSIAYFQQLEYNIGTSGDTLILQWWADGHPKPEPPQSKLMGVSAKLHISVDPTSECSVGASVSHVYPYILGGFQDAATGDVGALLKMSDMTSLEPGAGEGYCLFATVPTPLPVPWDGALIAYHVAANGTATRVTVRPLNTEVGYYGPAVDELRHTDGNPEEWAASALGGNMSQWWAIQAYDSGTPIFTETDDRLALQWWRDGETEPSAPTLEDIS
tara:strand:- start:2088 stop:2747 length:660 start_codon:yes stop_codon:yes gene_type:complete